MRELTLALAGVFQAAYLVFRTANEGLLPRHVEAPLIQSLFVRDPNDVDAVYGGSESLRDGLQLQSKMLDGDRPNIEIVRCALALLELGKQLGRRVDMAEQLGDRLDRAEQLQQMCGEDPSERLAEAYVDTVGQLKPRIIVRGKPGYLRQDAVVMHVRSLLLAGVRSAYLWRQLGGTRWQLLWRRRALLRETRSLLAQL